MCALGWIAAPPRQVRHCAVGFRLLRPCSPPCPTAVVPVGCGVERFRGCGLRGFSLSGVRANCWARGLGPCIAQMGPEDGGVGCAGVVGTHGGQALGAARFDGDAVHRTGLPGSPGHRSVGAVPIVSAHCPGSSLATDGRLDLVADGGPIIPSAVAVLVVLGCRAACRSLVDWEVHLPRLRRVVDEHVALARLADCSSAP